jgi:hypothetical protein
MTNLQYLRQTTCANFFSVALARAPIHALPCKILYRLVERRWLDGLRYVQIKSPAPGARAIVISSEGGAGDVVRGWLRPEVSRPA